MSGFPGRRAENARFGHAQAIAAASGAISMMGEDFEPQSRPTRLLLRGDGRLQDYGMVKKCP
jgi:crotonobetainyl-CoA:carnitine CoA-transferase CaiB-like acyl-CoA transferase